MCKAANQYEQMIYYLYDICDDMIQYDIYLACKANVFYNNWHETHCCNVINNSILFLFLNLFFYYTLPASSTRMSVLYLHILFLLYRGQRLPNDSKSQSRAALAKWFFICRRYISASALFPKSFLWKRISCWTNICGLINLNRIHILSWLLSGIEMSLVPLAD